jgi:hypothetical protein
LKRAIILTIQKETKQNPLAIFSRAEFESGIQTNKGREDAKTKV